MGNITCPLCEAFFIFWVYNESTGGEQEQSYVLNVNGTKHICARICAHKLYL